MSQKHDDKTSRPARRSPRRLTPLAWGLCALIGSTPHLVAQAPQTVTSAAGHHLAWADGRHTPLPVKPQALLGKVTSEGSSWWVPTTERLEESTRLTLWHGEADQTPAPLTVQEASDKVLFGPTPVIDGDELQGVLWSEGTLTQTTEIRFSVWQDGAFSEPAILSPRGKGTQTALSATVLEDGSWLAVWTAHDGEDSEVTWSRYRQGAWTAPARLTDNAVPDITPHVRTTAHGTYLAWSRYDGAGHYRVVMARFDGVASDGGAKDRGAKDGGAKDGHGIWSAPVEVGGPGTVYPQVEETDAAVLLFRQAVPAGWSAVRLDDQGRPAAGAHWPTDRKTAPILGQADAAHLELMWLSMDPNAEAPNADSHAASKQNGGAAPTAQPNTAAKVSQRALLPWQALSEATGEPLP